jgi:hypothetical protein
MCARRFIIMIGRVDVKIWRPKTAGVDAEFACHRRRVAVQQSATKTAGPCMPEKPLRYDVGMRWDGGYVYDGPPEPRSHMDQIKFSASSLPEPEVISTAKTVHTKMTGNSNFTTPNPTLVALQAAIDAAEQATDTYATAEQTLKEKLTQRVAAVDALRVLLTQESQYVANTAKGNGAVILSAGFAIRSGRGPAAPLEAVVNMSCSAGDHAGELDVMWDGQAGAKMYVLQICTGDPLVEANWRQVDLTTKSKFAVTGLTSGTRYWFRVAARGTGNTQGPWSDFAEKMAP